MPVNLKTRTLVGPWHRVLLTAGTFLVLSLTTVEAPAAALKPEQAEASIALGLKWLSARQAPDGSFQAGDQEKIKGTALAILAYLGGGQTHRDPKAAYAKTIDRAIQYLCLKQGPKGAFPGGDHALATLALCEALGKTADPALKLPAQRAVDVIVQTQNADGGWGDKAGDPSRLGNTYWNYQALLSAVRARLESPVAARRTSKKFLDLVSSPDGSSYGDVKLATNGAGGLPTAQGLVCRLFLGYGPRNPAIVNALKAFHQAQPSVEDRELAFFTIQFSHHVDSDESKQLKNKLVTALVAAQDNGAQQPAAKGSWAGMTDAARLTNTILAILSLEVHSRQVPLYRRDPKVNPLER